jgi:alpha-glucosidase
VIWLDIDYMDGYRCFTWHPADFPDPVGLMDRLHAQGFSVIAILDPGIKLEHGYSVYESGTAEDVWVGAATGRPYTGHVWPGLCVWPDFTMERARRWWADRVVDFVVVGVDGLWNDMNEPAVFHVDSKTMPLTNVHRADPALGGAGTHARYHNVYGMLMARASFEGLRRARPERRPFVLTRASHLGGQRWAATWTGDNVANWWHLDTSVAQVLNLGLSGQPLSGPDIGGFAGAGDARLFARWMGIGALLPFARGHTGKGNIDKEPWAFGPRAEEICRRALQRRYRLLPHYYGLFEEASRTGLPPARPLFFADPTDPRLRAEDDGFLLGTDLLVWCQTRPAADREPVLPAGDWTEVDLGITGDPDLPRLFLRAGAVLPLGPRVQSSREISPESAEWEVLVHPGHDGTATGILYEDGGDGYGYRQGQFARWAFTWSRGELRVEQSEGGMEGAKRDWIVTVVGTE